MKVSRRLFLGSCAVLPTLGALRVVPLAPVGQAAPLAGVGEVWGLPYWASGAVPAPLAAVTARRRLPPVLPGWHPDFS